jgi:hypothetical protein
MVNLNMCNSIKHFDDETFAIDADKINVSITSNKSTVLKITEIRNLFMHDKDKIALNSSDLPSRSKKYGFYTVYDKEGPKNALNNFDAGLKFFG